MCFVFPQLPEYFIMLLLGMSAASCISKKSEGISLTSFPLSLSVSISLFFNQQYGRSDLAARHHLQKFQERRFSLDNDAQSAAPDLEQWENTLYSEVKPFKTHGNTQNRKIKEQKSRADISQPMTAGKKNLFMRNTPSILILNANCILWLNKILPPVLTLSTDNKRHLDFSLSKEPDG